MTLYRLAMIELRVLLSATGLIAPSLSCGGVLRRSPGRALERADVEPADVELVGLHELGRCRIGVMVVVQLLATDDDAPGQHAARVRRLEVAIAPEVADAVDDAAP